MRRASLLALSCVLVLTACPSVERAPTPDPPPTPPATVAPQPATPSPEKMTNDDWKALAQRGLADAGIKNAADLTLSSGPAWMYSPRKTAPYRFYIAQAGDGEPGDEGAKWCVAVDTRDQKVHFRDEAAFGAFVLAKGLHDDATALEPADLLETWAVFDQGAEALVIRDAKTVYDEQHRDLVKPPTLEKTADGGLLLLGWTARLRGRTQELHQIKVSPAGKVESITLSTEDVLAKAKGN